MWLYTVLLSVRAPAACGPHPCLPGIDSIGIGFDAVRGTSLGVGRPVVKFNYSLGKTYIDPFGNHTIYGVPDEVTVTGKTTQFMGHKVARSISSFVSSQSEWAGLDAHFGPWFSASAETQETATQMGDSMHIVIESRQKISLYTATVDPPTLTMPDSKFQAMVDALPSSYDPIAYGEIVQYYGTHYLIVAEFGGMSRMRSVVTQDYYSTASDSELQAQAAIQWGLFGGGGGGGSSQHDTKQEWKDNTQCDTYTQGGDPAIKSFKSDDEWTRWAESVQTGAPVQTQYRLAEIASMVKDANKSMNLHKAVMDYAVAHNATWPAADPVNYQLGWCDCHTDTQSSIGDGCGSMGWHSCRTFGCSTAGYVAIAQAFDTGGSPEWSALPGYWCCRPCFQVSDVKARASTHKNFEIEAQSA